MRIGIVTFWDSQDNYGQLLQCFASQHYLQSIGYDAFLIKYKAVSHYKPDRSTKAIVNKIFSRAHWLFIFKKLKGQLFTNRQVSNTNRNFDIFRQQHLKTTEKLYTEKELMRSAPECEVLMCGSDQVWAGVPLDPIYFLQFGSKEQKRISLSSSFGRKRLPTTLMRSLQEYLVSLDAITVREQSALRICKEAGRVDAKLICDPTMLNSADIYNQLAEGDLSTGKVFIYYLGHKTQITDKQIVNFLGEAPYMYCASQGVENSIPKIYPTIPEWLGCIKHADFVITNSFHGTVFSLLFNKQFATIPLVNDDANDRIITLLEQLNLKSRVCRNINHLSNAVINKIDYRKVLPLLEKAQADGRSILSTILMDID